MLRVCNVTWLFNLFMDWMVREVKVRIIGQGGGLQYVVSQGV